MAINESTAKRIKTGATVRVFERLEDGDKAQIRRFEGLVLARKHGSEPGATFTVRATVAGVGVEKVFPLHSPTIERVEVLSSPRKVKRSKIYYVRELARKALRRKTVVKTEAEIEPEKEDGIVDLEVERKEEEGPVEEAKEAAKEEDVEEEKKEEAPAKEGETPTKEEPKKEE
ncbi:MAG: 50S ribosomal protein L19 [Candidatus Harrisonbacteria bacterium CG10_big_fil_rev_8_21_14_0_10_44_23]|uniref:50S ribosomal protein L19 n=1 Tax=Candidatus Harrisonbacteria bacterium CG10_big_fil_rev_8_21_14_0_10_44_23 TaxID=1974585 RepID=A0A2H0UQV4_9BACT|nr:MAG: 50S ribosomal protein L19 [Candidatus Harrisonbacteria bacterium CG10_big_fil_rev_8_21_14_0_10_44_23]